MGGEAPPEEDAQPDEVCHVRPACAHPTSAAYIFALTRRVGPRSLMCRARLTRPASQGRNKRAERCVRKVGTFLRSLHTITPTPPPPHFCGLQAAPGAAARRSSSRQAAVRADAKRRYIQAREVVDSDAEASATDEGQGGEEESGSEEESAEGGDGGYDDSDDDDDGMDIPLTLRAAAQQVRGGRERQLPRAHDTLHEGIANATQASQNTTQRPQEAIVEK